MHFYMTDRLGMYLIRRRQQRTHQIEDDDAEEDRRGQQSSIEFLHQTEKQTCDAHQHRDGDDHNIAEADLVLGVENRVTMHNEKTPL